MIYRIKIKHGAVVESKFVEASHQDGASVFYVDAESEARAIDEAKRRWRAKSEATRASERERRARGKCRSCPANAVPGKTLCAGCAARKSKFTCDVRRRKATLGIPRNAPLPVEMYHWLGNEIRRCNREAAAALAASPLRATAAE